MKKRTFIIVVCCVALAAASVVLFLTNKETRALPPQSEGSKSSTLLVGATTLSVEVMRTEAEHQKGLSGRSSLAADHGMLFIFDHPEKYGFWMPDMHFSIDIIWIDPTWHIIDIAHDVSPESYPKVFVPAEPGQYVLEVVAGKARALGWQKGMLVKFTE